MKTKTLSQFRSLDALTKYFSSDRKCTDFLAEQRWHGHPACPYCGCATIYHRKDGRYACKDCENTFSVLVGTVFQNTKIKLVKWFRAIYLMINNKQGISSVQLAREIEVTQSTAWHIMQKIRILLREQDDVFPDMVPGERVNLSDNSKKPLIVRRLTEPLKLHPSVLRFVKPGSRVFTDQYVCYQTLSESEQEKYRTEDPYGARIDAKGKTPVCQGVANGFWLQVKRMVMGIYHFVSAPLFHRYVFEALFRRKTFRDSNTIRFGRVMERVCQVIPYRQVSPRG